MHPTSTVFHYSLYRHPYFFHALPSSPAYFLYAVILMICEWPFLFLLPLFHYKSFPPELGGIYRMLYASIYSVSSTTYLSLSSLNETNH